MIPAIVQRFIDVLGYDDAITIVTRWGGTTLYIPDTVDGALRSQLSRVLGPDKAVLLGRKIGGGSISIPMCARMIAAQRDAEIVARQSDGEAVRDLALRFRLTERHIYRILKEAQNGA